MNTEQKFNLHTATDAELTAHIEAAMRAEKMNFAEKLQKLSDEKFLLTSDGQLMHNVIDFDHRGRGPEVIAAHRRYALARVAWLEANPGDDLDVAQIALLVKIATDNFRCVQELKIALTWCSEVEWHESTPEAKSETAHKLERRLLDRTREISDWLGSAITRPQWDYLRTIVGRRYPRGGCKFRLQRTTSAYEEMRRCRLIDFEIRHSRAFLCCANFQWAIEHARTVAEVKQIAAIWHTPIKGESRDGSTFLVGDGFEIIPQKT